MERYSAHIEFTDGSNPWVIFGVGRKTMTRILKKWMQRYRLALVRLDRRPKNNPLISNILWIKAEEKHPDKIDLFSVISQ